MKKEFTLLQLIYTFVLLFLGLIGIVDLFNSDWSPETIYVMLVAIISAVIIGALKIHRIMDPERAKQAEKDRLEADQKFFNTAKEVAELMKDEDVARENQQHPFIEKFAYDMRLAYDSLVAVGFSSDQAVELAETYMNEILDPMPEKDMWDLYTTLKAKGFEDRQAIKLIPIFYKNYG